MIKFKLAIVGGRDFTDYPLLENETIKFLEELGHTDSDDVVIVCGMARGADLLGHAFATDQGCEVIKYPAKWDELGRRAGFVRNEEMARVCDAVLAFWDGESRGTAHMINCAQRLNKAVKIVRYE